MWLSPIHIFYKYLQLSSHVGLTMAAVAFSHFYKIPLAPKVTKFIFHNIYSSLLTPSSREKKYFFDGEPIWKIQNLPKWPNIRIWDFQLFKFKFFLSILVSYQNNFCFLKQIYFCLTKKIVRLIAWIEKKIYYKRHI